MKWRYINYEKISLPHFHTILLQGNTEAADRKCFIKKIVLKTVWKKSQEITCAEVLF